MKLRYGLCVLGCFVAAPVAAGDYYYGFNGGSAAQQLTLTVVDNALDPQIPNVTVVKDYQAKQAEVNVGAMFVGYRMAYDLAVEVGAVRMRDMTGILRPVEADTNLSSNHMAEETFGTGFNYIVLVGVVPLTENLVFNARFGVAGWAINYSQRIIEVDVNNLYLADTRTEAYSDTGLAGLYGAGFSYAVSEWFELRLDYAAMKFEPTFVNVDVMQKVELSTLGVVIHF